MQGFIKFSLNLMGFIRSYSYTLFICLFKLEIVPPIWDLLTIIFFHFTIGRHQLAYPDFQCLNRQG